MLSTNYILQCRLSCICISSCPRVWSAWTWRPWACCRRPRPASAAARSAPPTWRWWRSAPPSHPGHRDNHVFLLLMIISLTTILGRYMMNIKDYSKTNPIFFLIQMKSTILCIKVAPSLFLTNKTLQITDSRWIWPAVWSRERSCGRACPPCRPPPRGTARGAPCGISGSSR